VKKASVCSQSFSSISVFLVVSAYLSKCASRRCSMPSGPVPATVRAGGWAAKKQSSSSNDVSVSTVYGADAQFREWVSKKESVTQDWAKNPLSPAPIDPRNATRRTGQSNAQVFAQTAGGVTKEAPKSVHSAIEDKIDQRFALFPMSRDEVDTAGVLINGVDGPEPRRLMRMLPTHHINAMGELSGYRFSSAPTDSCSALPLNRTMFHGTSAVQCMASTRSLMKNRVLKIHESKVCKFIEVTRSSS
jgi:hypothetical protein